MPQRKPIVTKAMLLKHMQAGFDSLRVDIRRGLRRLGAKIGTPREGLAAQITGLRSDIAELKRNDEKTHALIQRIMQLESGMVVR